MEKKKEKEKSVNPEETVCGGKTVTELTPVSVFLNRSKNYKRTTLNNNNNNNNIVSSLKSWRSEAKL